MAIDSEKIAAVKTAMDNTYEKRVNKKTTISGSYTGDTDSYPTILACINKFGELVTSWSVTPSDSNYPSEKLVKDTLENYIQKSQTAGLVKNDGTIDTNTYLTEHQDISGKANSADLATVATSGSYTDLTNVPQTFTPESHTHGNITATGAIGSDSGKMITTTTNGVLVASDMNEQLNTIILGLIEEGIPRVLQITYTGNSFPVNSLGRLTYTGDNLNVNWGDGNTEIYTSGQRGHVYNESGDYAVEITGDITSINSYFASYSDGSSITSVIIPKGVTTIGKEAFYKNTGLTSLVMSDSVTTLGEMMCSQCTSLTNLVISNNVQQIPKYCFKETGLTSVVIPEGVTSIGQNAFAYCYSLTSITLPESLTSITNQAFYSNDNLTTIICNWKTNPITYTKSWYYEYDNVNRTYSIPYGTTQIYINAGYPSDKLVEREEGE